ncbi:MAG: hypothetical protein K1X94_07690 [Sandaracinaceae bacterium]|jgi:hypothetical protein|nr:hypothetical protein [Sandaracinaceae bacterium]
MSKRPFTISLLGLALVCLGPVASRAHALRVMIPPPEPATSAAEVQTALAAVDAELQQCATSTGATSPARVMVNVHLFPQGLWSVTFGPPHGTPEVNLRGASPFEQCVGQALASRIGNRTETFAGTRPRTISRRYRITATPPTVTPTAPTVGPLSASHTAVVRRALTTRRAQIQGCFPHAARAPRVTIRLRVEVAPDGHLRMSGAHVPPHLDFVTVAQCLERALDGVRGPSTPGILRGEVPFVVQVDPDAAASAPPATAASEPARAE